MTSMNWLWRGRFQKIFLIVLAVQAVFSLMQRSGQARYASFQEWVADIIPASFGLITGAAIYSAIIYGIWRVVEKKKSKS